jgi:Glycosyltransferase family 87
LTADTKNSSRILRYWSIAVAFQTVLAIIAMLFPSAFGYGGKILVFDDVEIYFNDARPILKGTIPYRDYTVEYPLLAIPLFIAPLILGTNFEVYRFAFGAEMLLINALAVWLVARQVEESEGIEKVPRRLAWYSLFFATLCPMIVCRFDLAPMLLAFASTRWLAKGRLTAGGIAAGLGVLVKLVPGLAIVPFLAKAGAWRPKAKALTVFITTVALGGFGWWVLGGDQVAWSFRYHRERGLEIGSIYASAYLVAHKLAGVWIFTLFDHGSMNVSGPGAHDAASLSPILQGALLVLVVGRARSMAPGNDMRFAAAALVAYILPGKVLSPQYLIWLIPFVCAMGETSGISARRVFLGVCVLTRLLYPHLFHSLSYFEPLPVAVLAARSVGLVWLFAILLGRQARITPER